MNDDEPKDLLVVLDSSKDTSKQEKENSQAKKQDSLQFLKRMMNEINEEKDAEYADIERSPRKMIKKS